jgi:hypothetical protein
LQKTFAVPGSVFEMVILQLWNHETAIGRGNRLVTLHAQLADRGRHMAHITATGCIPGFAKPLHYSDSISSAILRRILGSLAM